MPEPASWRSQWPKCCVCDRPLHGTQDQTPAGLAHRHCQWAVDSAVLAILWHEDGCKVRAAGYNRVYDAAEAVMTGENLVLISLFAEAILNDPNL